MYILREGLQTATLKRLPDREQRSTAVDSVTTGEGEENSSGGCRGKTMSFAVC